ncbi:MAG: demethylmenaquinone methyltransferase [Actinomycetales bacterium]|nr:demethylmenaquinone methyltransferase [Actinomycetales bacterium]
MPAAPRARRSRFRPPRCARLRTSRENAPVSRPDLSKDPAAVASMFDRVARRYDLVNDLLSLGQARRWRSVVTGVVAAAAGQRVLDLAAGTGTSSAPLAAAGALVVPADFSLGMLRQGRRQQPHLPFVAADALQLPFADDAFDVVTISFGLRNVAGLQAALAEMRRVTAVGGRLVICEFSTPTNRLFRTIYRRYLGSMVRWASRAFSSDPAAYEYLGDSIVAWPDQRRLAEELTAAGWTAVRWRNLTGGIVAVHAATKTAPRA